MIYTHVAAAILGAAIAATVAWGVQDWRYGAIERHRIEAQHELERNNQKAADAASGGYEDDRAKTNWRQRAIRVEVDRIVERPVYRNVCLDDDGLRLLHGAIKRFDDPGESQGGLPGSD